MGELDPRDQDLVISRLTHLLKGPLRPFVRWGRKRLYTARFHRRLRQLQRGGPRRVHFAQTIDPQTSVDSLWQRLNAALPQRIRRSECWLGLPPLSDGINDYWQRYAPAYEGVGREKALEHALTFELLDFNRVSRYCDIAAATSPIHYPLRDDWEDVEAWRQDMLFQTDFEKRVIGGYAQSMGAVEAGFFDALTLHCSLEHFTGTSDVEFVREVDRTLSPRGACLILPLYVADTHRVYFDPTIVSSDVAFSYDTEGELYAVYGYHQEHGRFHSPETLASRLLGNVPLTLNATIIRFHDQQSVGPEIYLRFALVLHRADSVFREDPTQHSPAQS